MARNRGQRFQPSHPFTDRNITSDRASDHFEQPSNLFSDDYDTLFPPINGTQDATARRGNHEIESAPDRSGDSMVTSNTPGVQRWARLSAVVEGETVQCASAASLTTTSDNGATHTNNLDTKLTPTSTTDEDRDPGIRQLHRASLDEATYPSNPRASADQDDARSGSDQPILNETYAGEGEDESMNINFTPVSSSLDGQDDASELHTTSAVHVVSSYDSGQNRRGRWSGLSPYGATSGVPTCIYEKHKGRFNLPGSHRFCPKTGCAEQGDFSDKHSARELLAWSERFSERDGRAIGLEPPSPLSEEMLYIIPIFVDKQRRMLFRREWSLQKPPFVWTLPKIRSVEHQLGISSGMILYHNAFDEFR